MTDKAKKRTLLIYGIAMGVFTVIIGILLIASCITIYNSGERPFTRESVGDAFFKISIPVYVYFGALIAGPVLTLFLSDKSEKKSKTDTDSLLKILKEACPIDHISTERGTRIVKEERLRFRLGCSAILFFAFMALYPAIYLFSPANFSGVDPNGEIISATAVILSAFSLPTAYAIALSFFFKRSKMRECAEIKLAIKEYSNSQVTDFYVTRVPSIVEKANKVKARSKASAPRATLAARIIFLALGITFVILGISNGGMSDVLQKAVRICTECIGLG